MESIAFRSFLRRSCSCLCLKVLIPHKVSVIALPQVQGLFNLFSICLIIRRLGQNALPHTVSTTLQRWQLQAIVLSPVYLHVHDPEFAEYAPSGATLRAGRNHQLSPARRGKEDRHKPLLFKSCLVERSARVPREDSLAPCHGTSQRRLTLDCRPIMVSAPLRMTWQSRFKIEIMADDEEDVCNSCSVVQRRGW